MLLACGQPKSPAPGRLSPQDFERTPWETILHQAEGTTVNFAMWAGDEARNRYFQGPVTEKLKQKYGITLKIVPYNDTIEIVNKLLNEKGAGKISGGSVDMVWINGENFRTAKQGAVLWGPFSERLPNVRLYPEAARQRDFGTPIEGFEAVWQYAQFVLAYDMARTPEPPKSIEALRAWVKTHPGRFTYPAPPDFTGSVFIRHVLLHFGGNPQAFQNGFDEALYQKAAAPTLEYLNDIKPFLWKQGETFPATPKELDRLFTNQEIDFSMNYGPTFASQRIERGEFPPTVRTFVFDEGTIGNYNFLAIPFNAANLSGALTVINHLMSAEHMLDQSRVLGSTYPHDVSRLDAGQRTQMEALPRGPATLSPVELSSHLLPEPDAAYLDRLEKDWREKVLRKP